MLYVGWNPVVMPCSSKMVAFSVSQRSGGRGDTVAPNGGTVSKRPCRPFHCALLIRDWGHGWGRRSLTLTPEVVHAVRTTDLETYLDDTRAYPLAN